MTKIKEYLTIKEASEFLGIVPMTLRRWDKAGKLKPYRNPMNNYRLYRREDLGRLLGEISSE